MQGMGENLVVETFACLQMSEPLQWCALKNSALVDTHYTPFNTTFSRICTGHHTCAFLCSCLKIQLQHRSADCPSWQQWSVVLQYLPAGGVWWRWGLQAAAQWWATVLCLWGPWHAQSGCFHCHLQCCGLCGRGWVLYSGCIFVIFAVSVHWPSGSTHPYLDVQNVWKSLKCSITLLVILFQETLLQSCTVEWGTLPQYQPQTSTTVASVDFRFDQQTQRQKAARRILHHKETSLIWHNK